VLELDGPQIYNRYMLSLSPPRFKQWQVDALCLLYIFSFLHLNNFDDKLLN